MSWELLAGDTSKFALRLGLQEDPHAGASATPEESASWGSFQIWVHGRNLCAHMEMSETLHSVHWYLLPFLEWVADSWDALLHEERLPNANAGTTAAESLNLTRFPPPSLPGPEAELEWESAWYSWRLRHAIHAARSGGLFPDVTIRRWRDDVEVSWTAGPLPGRPAEFRYEFLAPTGQARLDPIDVAKPLHAVVSAATTELASRLPESERVAALSARLNRLRNDERHEQRVAWLAGLRTDHGEAVTRWRSIVDRLTSATDEVRQLVLGHHVDGLVMTEAPTAALLFGSASPTISPRDIDALLELASLAIDADYADISLSELVRPEPIPSAADVAAAAYELAAEVLEAVGWTGRYVDVQGILFGLDISVRDVTLTDERLRAIAVAGQPFRPTVGLNTRYRWADDRSRRFSFAHELCHILFDQSRRQRVAVVSGPWAPRDVERRANAFAAGLLMPPSAIERVIEDDGLHIETVAGMAALSDALGAGASATLQHTYNLGYIDRATRDILSEQFHWSRLNKRSK